MENRIICCPNTTSTPALSMHRNSQTISKPKPKIRITHIFAPEIIKTDAANFRELVQRLTGKPTTKPRKKEARTTKKMEIAMPMRAGFHAGFREEEEIWRSANSGGGFLGGFAEFDGFLQEITHFPFLESHVNGLPQPQLASLITEY